MKERLALMALDLPPGWHLLTENGWVRVAGPDATDDDLAHLPRCDLLLVGPAPVQPALWLCHERRRLAVPRGLPPLR
jgi:hypothetical protein